MATYAAAQRCMTALLASACRCTACSPAHMCACRLPVAIAAAVRFGCLPAIRACCAAGAGGWADCACSHAGAGPGGPGGGCGPAQHEQPGGHRDPQGAAVLCTGRLILWVPLRSVQLPHLVLHLPLVQAEMQWAAAAPLLSPVTGMEGAHGCSLSAYHLRMRADACGCSRCLLQPPHFAPAWAGCAGLDGTVWPVAALSFLSRHPPAGNLLSAPSSLSWCLPAGILVAAPRSAG